jgi:Ni/Co efflux regulator RcnB
MKRLLTTILSAALLGAPALAPASAQEVSHLNQDMDNRSNLQSEQTVDGHTSAPGVNVQQRQVTSQSKRRSRPRASKSPPHFRGSPPAHPVAAD